MIQKRGMFFIFALLFSIIIFSFAVLAQPQLYITSYCDASLEACRAQDQALELLEEDYPYDIVVDSLYYFDTDSAKSSLVHIALECANREGFKADYKAEIQNNLDDLSRTALKEYAENVGIFAANFSFCLDTQATAADVLAEVLEAEDDGVASAPSIRFNTKIYTGSQTYTSLHLLVKEYLEIGTEATSEEEIEITEETTAEEEETEAVAEKCLSGEVDPETGAMYKCGPGEETEETAEEEEQPSLEEAEEPLFFKVIKDFRNWLLSLFQ